MEERRQEWPSRRRLAESKLWVDVTRRYHHTCRPFARSAAKKACRDITKLDRARAWRCPTSRPNGCGRRRRAAHGAVRLDRLRGLRLRRRRMLAVAGRSACPSPCTAAAPRRIQAAPRPFSRLPRRELSSGEAPPIQGPSLSRSQSATSYQSTGTHRPTWRPCGSTSSMLSPTCSRRRCRLQPMLCSSRSRRQSKVKYDSRRGSTLRKKSCVILRRDAAAHFDVEDRLGGDGRAVVLLRPPSVVAFRPRRRQLELERR